MRVAPQIRHDRRMSFGPLRITSTWVKVLYILLWGASNFAVVNSVLGSLPLWPRVGLGMVWEAAWFVVAVRSFRVADEPLVPPRPWWKATGRPKASFVLGTLMALGLALSTGNAFVDQTWPWVLYIPYSAATSVYYLTSGNQQRRHPPAPRLAAPLPKARPVKL